MMKNDPTYALGRSEEEYQRLTEQAAFLRPLTERLFRKAGIGPGMRVLDVGSGAGDVAFLVSELVGPTGEVVGMDLDGNALEKARERAKLLNISNVTFVEGDVRNAELSGEFDAAVGRLILLYFADPLDGLSTIVRRIKKGGIVAFHEMDMNKDYNGLSYPVESIWNETAQTILQTFSGAGMHLRMGRLLMKTFLDAGLSFPSLTEEAIAGGGAVFSGYSWMANTLRNVAPLTEKLGIATVAELELDSLADRIRDDAVAGQITVSSPPMIGAYARRL